MVSLRCWPNFAEVATLAGPTSARWGNITVGEININGYNKDPDLLAREIRESMLRLKRSTGTLGLAS